MQYVFMIYNVEGGQRNTYLIPFNRSGFRSSQERKMIQLDMFVKTIN